MTLPAWFAPVPVPAVPPRPPQITLVGSSVVPSGAGDDVTFTYPDGSVWDLRGNAVGIGEAGEAYGDLRDEIAARDEEAWARTGFAYFPEAHAAASVRSIVDGTTVDTPTTANNLPIVQYVPIIHYVQFSASSFGFQTLDYIERAKRWLDNAIFASIEKEFWTGTEAQAITNCPNNYLTNIPDAAHNLTPGSTTTVDGTPCSIARGIAILQDAISNSGFGGQGMIHCIPGVSPTLLNVRRQGRLILDLFDNFIVPGAGYTGSKPDGTAAAAGTSWMYATDLVSTRIQKKPRVFPSNMAEATDRGQNDSDTPNLVTFRAEKLAAATADFYVHYAICVNLPS